MRVAIISYHTSPLAALGSSSAGGMNLYVRRLAEGLAARGVYVDVYTRRDGRHSPPITAFSPGARLISIPAGPERLLNKIELAAYTLPFTRQVAKFVAEESIQYDIIHSHYWLSGLAAQALKTNGQPLVHMFHTLSRVKRLYQPGANASDSPSRDCAEMRLLRADARLVFATGAEIDDVERVYGFRPKSVAIIPPGVDHDRFSPRDAQSARDALGLGPEKIVVCVGRMDRAKGVDALLEAAAVLQGASRVRAGQYHQDLTKTSLVGEYPRLVPGQNHQDLTRTSLDGDYPPAHTGQNDQELTKTSLDGDYPPARIGQNHQELTKISLVGDYPSARTAQNHQELTNTSLVEDYPSAVPP